MKATCHPEVNAPSGSSEQAEALTTQLSSDAIVRVDESLADHTTLHVGGPADLYVEPAGEDDLAAALRWCHQRAMPVFLLGRGSNLLVRDGGVRGAVICLNGPQWDSVQVRGTKVRCGAGAKLKFVANEAKRSGVAGLEFLEGIPGSVGGALRMNCGAHGSCVFDITKSVRVMDCQGIVRDVDAAELEPEYRSCPYFQTHIALSAVLVGRAGTPADIQAQMDLLNQKRWHTQPAAPSAGCIFKNPARIPAGRLVEELGLKGTRVGGAMVSLEHGNFIVTERSATASDVLRLVDLIRERARAGRGIELDTEVQVIGEECREE